MAQVRVLAPETSLTDFLLARITEDMTRPIDRHIADRWWADGRAKRLIISEHADYGGYGETCQTCAESDIDNKAWPCPTLRALAQPYADHSGFREEWSA